MEETFLSEMIGSGRFKVIGGRNRGSDKISDNDGDAAEFARKTNAEFAMTGKGIVKKNSLEIHVRMIDAADSEIISTHDMYGEDTDIRTLCKGLMVKLKDEFPIVEGQIVKVRIGKLLSISERRAGSKRNAGNFL
ncbi:MAG: hypothetical protein HC887_00480 [Desulfobacteraceae bacterium]|nr:hypothetical protein [Desulfobacteraceae bacterium]